MIGGPSIITVPNAALYRWRGHKAISAKVDWMFVASQPPGDRPFGAYFTTLRPNSRRFSARTRIPKLKQGFVFEFDGMDGLEPIAGGKGATFFGVRLTTWCLSFDKGIMVRQRNCHDRWPRHPYLDQTRH